MARNKNKALFEGALDEPRSSTPKSGANAKASSSERARHRYLEGRHNELARIAAGEYVHKTLHLVDPARCRIWAHHNRRYELLNEDRCQDLIEGIKAQNRQEFPAIVRKVADDPHYDYEVICGARRHWAITWLRKHHYDFKFLIEIRDISDEEAFRLSDVENRDRVDISDYERAVDYNKALSMYYGNNLSQMADRLEVNVDWLSRYLDLAKLPQEIVTAYPDVIHIRIQHGRELKPLLKDGRTRNRVLYRAAELTKEQVHAREAGQRLLDGKEVVRELKAAARTRKSNPGVLATYDTAETKKPMLEVTRKGRSGLILRVVPGSGASADELLEACKQAFADFMG